MTQRTFLILAAAGASLAVLLSAFAFQYLGGMYPCSLCLWQRWPHAAAVLIGALALWLSDGLAGRALPLMGALAMLGGSAIGVFHTGVERDWWEYLNVCTVGPIGDMSAEDLMAQIMAAPLVRCDVVSLEIFTLSMASWNAIASLGMAVLWLMAAKTFSQAPKNF